MSWDVPGSVRVWVGVGFGLWLGVGGLGRPRTFDGNPGHPSQSMLLLVIVFIYSLYICMHTFVQYSHLRY